MKKLKIAIYYNLPPGGAKYTIEGIIFGLKKRGHILDVYQGDDFQFIEIKTKKIGVFNSLLLPFNLWRYERFSKKLSLKINQKNYDATIITNSVILPHPYILRYLNFPKLLISQEPLRIAYERGLHKEYIYKRYYNYKNIIRNFIFIYSLSGILFRKKADEENLKCADRLIVNSNFSKENFLANYGIIGKVVYPGIDIKIFKPNLEKKENLILSVGSFNGLKGHDLVIKALTFIPPEKRPSLKILGFGNSQLSQKEFQYLKKLRNDSNLKEKVKFENSPLRKEIVSYYQKAYLTICASFLEPFGLVPLESMACGTPVIAVKEGGFRETVKHNETGLLVERDPQELANAILYLLENKETWKRFSKNGPEWVKSNFSLEKTINRVEKELFNLVKNHEGRH